MTSPEWEAANEDDSDRFPQTSHASAPESTESQRYGHQMGVTDEWVSRTRAAEATLAKVEAERGQLWSRVFSALSRAEQIEPQGSPEWVESGNAMRTTVIREVRLALGEMPMSDEGVARIVDDLGAVLADAPAEQRDGA